MSQQFSYNTTVLDFQSIPKGTQVCIIGAKGSGKTSVAHKVPNATLFFANDAINEETTDNDEPTTYVYERQDANRIGKFAPDIIILSGPQSRGVVHTLFKHCMHYLPEQLREIRTFANFVEETMKPDYHRFVIWITPEARLGKAPAQFYHIGDLKQPLVD